MAENDTQQHDRTEQPSAKRLDDARARGQVPRSHELAATAVVISGALALQVAISRAAWLAGISLAVLAASLVLIAAVDVPFQFWHHHRQLRMTKQETRDELKETEGRPEVRSRIRALQRSIATRRMMTAVPKADVVAMNPSHYAV